MAIRIRPDPVAKAHFLASAGDIDSAQLQVRAAQQAQTRQPITNLESAMETMKNLPWTALQDLKEDASVLQKLAEAEELIKSLRKALSTD